MLNTQRLLLLAWDNLGVGIIVVITTRDKHYYDELEYEEIARVLDSKVETLKVNYHYAKDKIKEYILNR